ncbi:YbbR domain-containing protein [Virgibacillus halotolerans]|uniref:CdaR family protein n=1 Tax=Virgibacillus halotolerans TaxID=1071053 RepID=UPI00195FE736|nr:CdaR family protein [Virgibacillus halotolerans]MBM7599453.1 YbbR domain-containing protein [Virgibacillus halotolerans]
MDKLFRSKWFVLTVSLAFAIALFVFVNVESDKTDTEPSIFPGKSEEMQTLSDVPVGIRIDNEKYVVSGVPEFVTVSFKGSTGVLTPTIRQRNFDVFVDLEGLGEGEHEVEVEYANVPKDLSAFIEPKTVEVTIEEKATKEFPVNVDFINTENMAAGYELGDHEVNPGTITVTSSKSVIEQIGVVKVFVDVTDVNEAINKREVPVNVYDTQGNELNVNIEPENVLVSADVDNPSKTVSVNVPTKGELPEGYELTSISADVDEVEIFAKNSILDELNEISTEEIDLSEINKSGEVEAKLDLPEGVSVPDGEEVGVSFKVKKIEDSGETEETGKTEDKEQTQETGKTEDKEQSEETEETAETAETRGTATISFEQVPIKAENLPEDQDISFIEPGDSAMDITVDGDEADIDQLRAEDFEIGIDVDSLAPGEHTVPVSIKGPDDIDVNGEFEEVTIGIN